MFTAAMFQDIAFHTLKIHSLAFDQDGIGELVLSQKKKTVSRKYTLSISKSVIVKSARYAAFPSASQIETEEDRIDLSRAFHCLMRVYQHHPSLRLRHLYGKIQIEVLGSESFIHFDTYSSQCTEMYGDEREEALWDHYQRILAVPGSATDLTAEKILIAVGREGHVLQRKLRKLGIIKEEFLTNGLTRQLFFSHEAFRFHDTCASRFMEELKNIGFPGVLLITQPVNMRRRRE